jgi:hypothetical protein
MAIETQGGLRLFPKHLGLAAAEEELNKITIEPPEKMAVFDDQHPLRPAR